MLRHGHLRFPVLVYLILYSIAGLAVAAGIVALHQGVFADRSNGRPRCPRCWYDMTGSRGFVCPECGNDAANQANLHRTRRRGMESVLGALLITSGVVLAAVPTVQDQGWSALIPTTALMIVMPWTDNAWVFEEVDARVNGTYPEWFRRRRVTGEISAYGRFFAHRCAAVLESSEDRARRLWAVQLLSDMRLRDDRSERALLAATGDVDPTNRNEALNALTRISAAHSIVDPGRCARRVAECLADTRSAVSTRAARFLAELPPHPDALPALIDALSDDRPEVRAEVCLVLNNYGPTAEPARPVLIRLIDDPSTLVSSRAIRTLSSLGYAAFPAVDSIIRATSFDDRRGDAALRAIAQLGPVASTAIPRLTAMLTDQSLPNYRRELALGALIEIGLYEPAVLNAIELAATSNIEAARQRVASELGRVHADDRRQIQLLFGLLGDASPEVREEAALSLGRIHTLRDEEFAQLRQLAGDSSFPGWEQAQSALSRALEDAPTSDANSLNTPVAESRR